jgi:hypothetical protein
MLVWTSQASPPSMPSMIMMMKHSAMLPTSKKRDIKAFSCLKNGLNFRLVIIVDRKGTSDHTAKSILLQKQMVLFPLHMRNCPICQYLPIPRIAAISLKRIQNSRHFCLLFQPLPPNILLSPQLIKMKMQTMITMQTMLQTFMMTTMISTLFWEWWELKKNRRWSSWFP